MRNCVIDYLEDTQHSFSKVIDFIKDNPTKFGGSVGEVVTGVEIYWTEESGFGLDVELEHPTEYWGSGSAFPLETALKIIGEVEGVIGGNTTGSN